MTKEFVEIIISNLSPLFLQGVSRYQADRSSKIALGSYLLFSFVIISQFSNYLIDYLQTELPTIKINTLEELASSDLQIILRHDSALIQLFKNNKSEIATKFKQDRFEPFSDFHFQHIDDKLVEGLMNGSVAYVNEHYLLIKDLMKMVEKTKIPIFDFVRISTEDAGHEPYLISFNPELPQWASLALDKV